MGGNAWQRRPTATVLAVIALSALLPRAAGGETATAQAAVLGLCGEAELRHEALELRRVVTAVVARAEVGAEDLDRLRSRRDHALSEEDRRRVDRLSDEARQHFLDFRFPLAAAALERAREALLGRYADLLEDPAHVAVSLDLARVYLDMGETERASTTLVELARSRPDVEPDPADYPPPLLEAWAAARRRAGEEPVEDRALHPSRAAAAGRALGLTHVVTGSVFRHDEGGLVARLVLVRSATGEATTLQDIPLGAPSTWAASVAPVLGPLLERSRRSLPSSSERATELFVLSTPPGADIVLDGTPLEAQTPSTVTVQPGIHNVRLSLEGHRTEEVSVVAWPRQTRPVEVTLSRRRERELTRAWWLWTLVGLAAAGAAAGITIWALWAAEDLPDGTVRVQTSALGARF